MSAIDGIAAVSDKSTPSGRWVTSESSTAANSGSVALENARTRSPDLKVNRQDCRCALTNSDLSSHAINQLLGIVANPSLKHCFDVLDLVNSF